MKIPIVAVGVFILCEDKVLLIKRGKEPAKGLYSIPGGSQNLGETNTEAAIREVLEETHITLSSLQLFEVFDAIHEQNGDIKYHYVIVDYLAHIQPHEKNLAKAGSDAAEIVWATYQEAKNLPLTKELLPLIEKALRTHP